MLIDESIRLDQEHIIIMRKAKDVKLDFVQQNIKASMESIKFLLKIRKDLHGSDK